MPKQSYEYDVALSFAGEDRILAERLAAALESSSVRVFYDRYEVATLWGKDLYEHLQTIYQDTAKYCVVFVSQHYADKVWTRHELRQAQARAASDSRCGYILPLRLDDTDLPGLSDTVAYVDLRVTEIDKVTELLLQKLFGEDYAITPTPRCNGAIASRRGDSIDLHLLSWKEQSTT